MSDVFIICAFIYLIGMIYTLAKVIERSKKIRSEPDTILVEIVGIVIAYGFTLLVWPYYLGTMSERK